MTETGPKQLALDFRWDETADFTSFVAGPNAEAVAAVANAASSPRQPIYLYGAPGTGKSHLLQAACGHATAQGRTAVYLPLAHKHGWTAALLDGMENVALVAVDDLDALRGDAVWQESVFHLFNRLRDAGAQLAVAALQRPDRLRLELADLISRLQWGLVLRLRELGDEDKLAALQYRAQRRGLELPAQTARHLLAHYPRQTAELLALLERLDEASLREARRLTIPFVKAVLKDGEREVKNAVHDAGAERVRRT